MNVRIQTQGATTAVQVLKKSLEDMESLCDMLENSFDEAVECYAKA